MKKLKLYRDYNGWMIRYKYGFSFKSLAYKRATAWEKEMSGWTITKKQLIKKYGARAVKVKITVVK